MTASYCTSTPRILVAIDVAKAKHDVLIELPNGRRSNRGLQEVARHWAARAGTSATPSSGSCSTWSAYAPRRRTSPEWRWKKPSAERRMPVPCLLSFRIKWREL